LHKLHKVQKSTELHAVVSHHPMEFEVVEGLPFLAKVNVQGKIGPLKIHLSYLRQGDLHLYGAFKNEEPTYDKNEFRKINQPK